MNAIIEWFARHSIAANLLVLATVICGALAAMEIPKEIIPAIEPDSITITTALPGASPAITESSLCTPIENGIRTLPDIAHIRSLSSSGQCVVNVELTSAADIKKTITDISAGLSLLPLPAQAGKPLIANTRKEPIITRLSVSGLVDYRLLQDTAQKVASELQAQGISKVRVIETKKRQIAIDVSPVLLQQYQISMSEIANALRVNGLNLPGGNIAGSKGDSSVIVSSEFSNIPELGNTVIRSLPDGSQLRLQDIANIHEEYSSLEARVNGQPAVAIVIYQGNNTDLFEISDIAHRYIESTSNKLPPDIKLDIVFDNAQFFSARMNYLKNNFLSGLVVSSIILLLWLRLRLAFWITIDIPIAFAGGIIWLYLMNGSLNMVSAFGLIVVLGIVCDDAIVIGENIYRHQCSGKPGLEGAITGAQEVAKTVIFAVSTTVLMFVPLLFLPGSEGKLMQPLPMIVIAILIASLIEALLVLPTHLAHHSDFKPSQSLGYAVAEKMDDFVLTLYRPLLQTALQWRYSVVAICTALFIISVSLVLSGTINVHFFSAIETEIATGAVSFPNKNDTEKTRQAVRKMEQAALALKSELQQEFGITQIDIVRSFVADNATHGEVYLGLAQSGQRKIDSATIMQKWKEKTGIISGASELTFHATVDVDTSRFNVLLRSNNSIQLEKAAAALQHHLQTVAGVSSINNLSANAREEILLELKPDAFDMGLNLQTVAAQVHMALEETALQKINGDNVVLKLAGAAQLSISELAYLPIQVNLLNTVPLSSIADIRFGKNAEAIQHIDGQQVAIINAEIDSNVISANALMKQVNAEFLQSLDKNFPGVSWKKTGMLEAESKIKHYLALSFILSLLAMFVMLAIFLNSYFQPLMIFTAIPFGIVGALLGHLLFGQPLTLWSMAGMIAVSGIVVNNNMVIIFFINDRVAAGEDMTNTLLKAGADRFRPIMLTTITTFAGVFPTIMGNSWEAQFLIPLAISIGCGVMFAAVLTLFLVPCLYLVADDIKRQYMHNSKI